MHLFASADRFLFEMSLIPHYPQRLKAIFFLRKVLFPFVTSNHHTLQFDERFDATVKWMQTVLQACTQLKTSKALKLYFEIILALGLVLLSIGHM